MLSIVTERVVPGMSCKNGSGQIVIVPCIVASRVGSDIDAAVRLSHLKGIETILQ